MPRRMLPGLLVFVVASGCGGHGRAAPDTGARQCLKVFFEAVVEKNWEESYAALDPPSKRACTQAQFQVLAQNYLRGLGFVPESVRLQFCEEQGMEARGHVVLEGHLEDKSRRYKDAVLLRRSDDCWGIVLPSSW